MAWELSRGRSARAHRGSPSPTSFPWHISVAWLLSVHISLLPILRDAGATSAHSLSRIRCASLLATVARCSIGSRPLDRAGCLLHIQHLFREERHGGEGTEKTHTATPPLRFFLPSSPHGSPPIVAHLCEVPCSDRSGAGGVLRIRQVGPRTRLPISSSNALRANLGTTTGVSPEPRCTLTESLIDWTAQERFSRSGPSVVRARCCSGTRACARRTSRRV